jgi:hypothetical protein
MFAIKQRYPRVLFFYTSSYSIVVVEWSDDDSTRFLSCKRRKFIPHLQYREWK